MSQSIQLSLKTSIFDRTRELTIAPGFIEFDDTNLSVETPTRMVKSEITGFRYGVKAINGYRFRIGRIYCIDIQSSTGSIIKIRLKSVYRINRKKLGVKYNQIVQAIAENYINDISRDLLQKFTNKENISILGVTFTQEEILFDKENIAISWLDLGTKNYWSYYSLFSLSSPDKYKTFQNLTEWNVFILYTVSRQIIKMKKI